MSERFAAEADASALVFTSQALEAERHEISGEDGHHLARARRVQPMETVVVADGKGHWRTCEVVAVEGATVDLRAEGPVLVEPVLSPSVTIAFAPAKADHASTVVHQLVELGVERIVPIGTARSVVRWEGDRAERAHARLQRVAREAAAQARRARIPEVARFTDVRALAGRSGLVVADRLGCPADTLAKPRGGEWIVVVGPEGGLERGEIDALGAISLLAVGPHVLRSVTAPVAVAAALSSYRAH